MKFKHPVLLGALLAPLFAISQPALANIYITFDYRYDSSHFFTGENSSRQNLLNAAASVFETRFQDNLTGISSSGSDRFDPRFIQPDTGLNTKFSNFSIAPDQIVVFVGSYNMGSTLAASGPGKVSGVGSADFFDNALSRGQAGALLPMQTDLGPWGGAISFNNNSNWYFDPDITTNEPFPNKYDFYSVAVHELAHVLGFGSAPSFNNLVANGAFTGSAVHDLYGSNPPVTRDGHWAPKLSYLGQEAAMDPSIATNQRSPFTELDYAAMKDIGWQVSSIPEPETWTLMIAGLGLLGGHLRASARKGERKS